MTDKDGWYLLHDWVEHPINEAGEYDPTAGDIQNRRDIIGPFERKGDAYTFYATDLGRYSGWDARPIRLNEFPVQRQITPDSFRAWFKGEDGYGYLDLDMDLAQPEDPALIKRYVAETIQSELSEFKKTVRDICDQEISEIDESDFDVDSQIEHYLDYHGLDLDMSDYVDEIRRLITLKCEDVEDFDTQVHYHLDDFRREVNEMISKSIAEAVNNLRITYKWGIRFKLFQKEVKRKWTSRR